MENGVLFPKQWVVFSKLIFSDKRDSANKKKEKFDKFFFTKL